MEEWLKKTFRIATWLPDYDTAKLSGDITAGLTTGAMFIPQGMAYAVIAGVPPIYGLYAGVIPLFIYPLLATSRHLSIGPVSVNMLIIAAGISALAKVNTTEYIALTILLTMVTGLLQLLMGSLRLGSILNFFSRPVIAGFTLAAPIIIAGTQLQNLMGIQLPNTQYIFYILEGVIQNIDQIHYATFACGMGAIALLVLLKSIHSKLPAFVIVLFLGIFAAWFIDLGSYGVHLVGEIPKGLPAFQLPKITFNRMRELLPTALTLALVQFMSVASIGQALAKRYNYIIDPNHELIALGASNFLGSFFQSIPVAGSFSQTAAAEQANVKTPLANVFMSLVIIATLLFLTPIFYYLPMPVLAAITIVAVFGLINIGEFKSLFSTKRSEGFIAVFTAICTLLIGIQEGILLGVVASMLNILYKYSRPNVAELGVIPGSRLYQNIERHPEAKAIEGILILRVDASFSFINAEFFRDFILEKSRERNKSTHYVIIDGSTINTLDTTATDQLKSMITTLRNWDIELYITGLKGPVRDVIDKSGLREFLGDDHYYREPHEAVKKILELMDQKNHTSRLEEYKNVTS
ncbi:MAG TPA: sulfate permease [Balneolaceae bacterium]|nr:sulfate permease [Balneolaceae bacterium]